MTPQHYIRDGDAIYARSFAIIRAEADLSRFSSEEAEVAVRMIHACGVVEAAPSSASPRASWTPPAVRCGPARRSSAMPRWWRTA